MSINAALSNALSGLRANGRLAEVTANNLANALTEGYGRQSVALGASVTGGAGTGVAVRGVERALDPELSGARRIADGDFARATARFDGLRRLERAIGTVEDEGSLANRAAAFESALRALAETPESAPRQRAAAEAGRDLAGKLNAVSDTVRAVREEADAGIARRVGSVNDALGRIARLNRQMQVFTAAGRDTAALVDERERLIDTVSQNLPLRESRRPDGVVELRTASGMPLVDTVARRLSFAPSPVITPDLSLEDGTLGRLVLEGAGMPAGGRDLTPGGGGRYRVEGGALAGLFELRDRLAPAAQARADAVAADLVVRTPDPDGNPDGAVEADRPGVFLDGAAADEAFERYAAPRAVTGMAPDGTVDLGAAHGLEAGALVRLDHTAPQRILRVIEVVDADTLRVGSPGGEALAGLPTGATQLAAVDTAGLAGRVALNPAVDPAAGGDPARLRDGIAAPAPQDRGADATFPRRLLDGLTAGMDARGAPGLAGRLSLAGLVGGVAEIAATDRVGAEAEVSALGAARETLAAEESETLGVDNDEEMRRLVEIEQAYAANAQVIRTASRMLEELTEIR
jgi:flagellar hook-associated protein 1 FlgK